jgi:hypothetical protein
MSRLRNNPELPSVFLGPDTCDLRPFSWQPGRDSNPDTQLQRLQSYR